MSQDWDKADITHGTTGRILWKSPHQLGVSISFDGVLLKAMTSESRLGLSGSCHGKDMETLCLD